MLKKIWLIFASWRMAVVWLHGFASGIPLALTAATLQAWMKDEQVDLTTIGLFALVGMPYTIKFLWAPLMDRYIPPFLGRRRGWIVVCEIAIIAAIVGLSMSSPKAHPFVVAALALSLAFTAASHDIVVDAYRAELLAPEEYGIGNSLYTMAYRIAMIISGGGALVLADHLPWRVVYLIMGAIMTVGIVTTIFAPEPQADAKPPRSLQEAVVVPLIEFFKRAGAIETLIFLVIYKLDTNLTIAMTTPFMMDMGFSKTEIGAVVKSFGVFATIIGALAGGAMMVKLELKRSLWIFGIAQAVAGMTYFALSKAGHNYPVMVAAVTTENFFSGMGIAALNALMMVMCDKRFTASQYALISSFMALSRYVAGAPSGWLAEHLGWSNYYIACTLIGIPSLLMLLRFERWRMPGHD